MSSLWKLFVAAVILVQITSFTALAQEEEGRFYLVESLPPGALSPPDSFDLSNPRGALRSFTEATEAKDFAAAAAALRTGPEPEMPRADLARMLGEVIDRQLWISGGTLSDRPDALIESVGDNPRAGTARRSIDLGTIDRGEFPVTIRLNRYKTENSRAVWLFSEETVAATPALYALHGPGWIEAKLPAWWRERSILSVRHWEIAALPLLLLGAALIGRIVNGFVGWVHGLSGTGWPARAVSGSATPLAILAATIFAQTVINSALGFSGEITSFLTPVLIAGMVVALLMAILRVIDAGLNVVTRHYVGEIDDRLSRDDRQLYTSVYALRRVVTLLAFLIGAGLVFWEIGAFRNVGISLLASAGVATVILGIAGQTVLGNILASLQIAIAKPIRIGDSVNYEDQWAYVEAIYYTYVQLRTWDERRLLVPVQYFISHPFENWSMTDAKMIKSFYLILDHTAEPDALRDKFLEIARRDEAAIDDAAMKMQVLDHDADGVHYRFYATAADPTAAWDMHARLREEMLNWVRKEHPEWWPREWVKSTEKDVTAAPDMDG